MEVRARHIIIIFLLVFSARALRAQDDGGGAQDRTRTDALDVTARRSEITEEAGGELLSLNPGDSEVSLLISGYWKASLFGSWGLANTRYGLAAAQSDSPVMFTQEADLLLSLWIRERWFVEASFQEDNYAPNTYRAGFQGKDGDFVRYAGVGNTGLDFPVFPYLDLGGDSTSSFGFYGAFGSGPLTFHTLVRYDDAEREEKIFSGGRERKFSYLSASNIMRGVSFVLPRDNLASAPVVYFEDADGDLREANGRRWRRARPSEAASSAHYGIVELAQSPAGMVAVSYPAPTGSYDNDMGSYGLLGTVTGGGGAGFLGAVQDFFDNGAILSSYPQPGGRTGKPAVISIGGASALVIYEKGAFSPFERQSRYNAPASGMADAALVSSSTKEVVRGFELSELSDGSASLPLYVQEEFDANIYARPVYNLSRSGVTDMRSPVSRWPLAKDLQEESWLPSIYLSGGGSGASDVELRWTGYAAQSGYNIGTDVIPGSVEVIRGGISDPNWTFDAASGTVRLAAPAAVNEIVRVRYLRRSLEKRNGSLAIGLGAVYEDKGHFSTRTALGLRWNVSEEGYSEAGTTSPGVIGLGSKAAWNYDNFNAALTLGAGYEQPDTLGLYRVAGMEGHETELPPPARPRSFLSNPPAQTSAVPADLTTANRADLVYRNYTETDWAGASTLHDIGWKGGDAPKISDINDPYIARDNAQDARVLVAEFTLNSTDKKWTGFESQLPDGHALAEASAITVPFRFYGTSGDSSGLELVFQFGPLSAKDSGGAENTGLIVERTAAVPAGDAAGYFAFTLTDAERRKLRGATYARLLVIKNSGGAFSGRVLLAPPVVKGAQFSPLVADSGGIVDELDDFPVSTIETPDAGLAAAYPEILKRLHPDSETQRVLKIEWPTLPEPDLAPGAGARIGQIPFSNYKTLSFFVFFPEAPASSDFNGATLDFYVARGRTSLGKSSETALEAHIPAGRLGSGWTKIELRYSIAESGVYINGGNIAPLTYRGNVLRKNPHRASEEGEDEDSAYIMVFLTPAPTGTVTLPNGSFSIDEIILEEGESDYYLNAGGSVNWRHPGTLLELRGVKIIENTNFETALETSTRGNPESESKGSFFGMTDRSRAAVTLLGATLSANAAFSVQRDDYSTISWWTAGHGVARNFGPLSIREEFFLDPSAPLWKHEAGASLPGNYSARFSGNAMLENGKKNRAWQAGLGAVHIAGTPAGLSVDADWRWVEPEKPITAASAASQDINTALPDDTIDDNYGMVWAESWKFWAPDSGGNAEKRTMHEKTELRWSETAAPLGVILTLDMNSDAGRSQLRTSSGGRARLAFPFKLKGGLNGTYRMERRYERGVLRFGSSAGDDMASFSETFAYSGDTLAAIPFYALGDPELAEKFRTALQSAPQAFNTESAATGDLYGLDLQFPAQAGLRGLFLPAAAAAHVDRNITIKYDTPQDILGTGATLDFSSVDLFGAFGSKKIFKIYQNDEFHHSVQAAAAFPKNDETSWRVSIQQGATFFGFKGAELQLENIVALLRPGWTGSFSIAHLVPEEKTLLGIFYGWAIGKLKDNKYSPAFNTISQSGYTRLRKEKLDLAFDYSGEYPFYAISAGHESIVRVASRLEFRVFAAFTYSQFSETETQTFTTTIGTSLNVSF
jgi:hypothetical protein